MTKLLDIKTLVAQEKVKLKELVEAIKDEVLSEFNQGERKYAREEIKVKIIK